MPFIVISNYKGMRYGVPYKGSKNAIAEWVYSFFPKNNKKNFYDLFAGGCAVTHAAMLDGAYKNYIINDIDGGGISVFTDAINGKFADAATLTHILTSALTMKSFINGAKSRQSRFLFQNTPCRKTALQK